MLLLMQLFGLKPHYLPRKATLFLICAVLFPTACVLFSPRSRQPVAVLQGQYVRPWARTYRLPGVLIQSPAVH